MATPHRERIGSSRSLLAAATLAFVALGMTVPAPAQPSRAGSGEVIAIRELKLKNGVDVNQFERSSPERTTLDGKAPRLG